MTVDVAVVTPVYGNEATLASLYERLAAALDGRDWRLRFVVDASPDASLAVARRLANQDARIAVTALDRNVGQNRALTLGLAAELRAHAWVCLDADLQDPPEAVPELLDRLAVGDASAVFAGRRGAYQGAARRFTGALHRRVVNRLANVPLDAGAFVALGPEARHAVVTFDGPSIVAAIGVSGVCCVSVPVERSARSHGRSTWTSTARARQSARTLAWLASHHSQSWTRVSA